MRNFRPQVGQEFRHGKHFYLKVSYDIDIVYIMSYCVRMIFEWDEEKNIANQQKHGVNFEEVIPLFYQPYELSYDKDHSTSNEDRWIAKANLSPHGPVIVVFIELVDNVIRIISARKEGR